MTGLEGTFAALLYTRGTALVTDHVAAATAADLGRRTPCAEWDVRDLVAHLVEEDRWADALLAGETLEDVGARFEGDLVGDDPAAAWTDARTRVLARLATTPADRTVTLSTGPTAAVDYLAELGADHLIHAWDLARALGRPDDLPGDLVDGVASWFDDHEAEWRAYGAIADPAPVAAGAPPQTRLLARFGRRR